VVQVSRWDRLKDAIGVLRGFAQSTSPAVQGSHLILAGPNTRSVADDPEDAIVCREVAEAWRALPLEAQARISLVALPTVDVDENAAIVNALQRHAAVIVQKSLHEGFGLTVTEALWKSRPVIASAVGGIQDQITDGVQGLLLKDPSNLAAFGELLERLLTDAELSKQLGEQGHARVLDRYLGVHSLLKYGDLIERLDQRAIDTLSSTG
jgi:trehalose synthase